MAASIATPGELWRCCRPLNRLVEPLEDDLCRVAFWTVPTVVGYLYVIVLRFRGAVFHDGASAVQVDLSDLHLQRTLEGRRQQPDVVHKVGSEIRGDAGFIEAFFDLARPLWVIHV